MNPKYISDDDSFDVRAAHVIEECSEVIKEYGKAHRFGWYSYHPNDESRETNRSAFLS